MLVHYHEQKWKVENDRKLYGVQNIRLVEADRKSPGGVDEAARLLPLVLDALTKPLTAKEKKGGNWEVEEPRVLFEGTIAEAEKVYARDRKHRGGT